VAQGSNATFTVGVNGSGPFGFQWNYDNNPISNATNSSLTLSNVQPANAGSYSVLVSSAFGSVLSSNAILTVDPLPVITAQPQSQIVPTGSNVAFSVLVAGAASAPTLPAVSSGNLQLWLRADTGVVTNSNGRVTQWNDQSTNLNNAIQASASMQPSLVLVSALAGKPVVRFNGIQDNVNGSWMHGAASVGVPNAMTAFVLYSTFATSNTDDMLWFIGVPGTYGGSRGDDLVAGGDMRFTTWAYDYTVSYTPPTNTYRIWTDRLNTNLTSLNIFDATASTSTNFTLSMSGASAPGAGYYVGGLDPSQPNVGNSRCFNGDVAELLIYKGYLSDADRTAVAGYLSQKYYASAGSNITYQWQFDGTNIANATNSSLTLTNVQLTNAGTYTVTVSNLIGLVVSSNAVLTVGVPPSIATQPQTLEVGQGTNVAFTVGVNGTGPFAFQWNFDGGPIGNATNSSLTLTNVQTTNSGSYSVLVTSAFGSTLSSNAVLTVDATPLIVIQPQGQTVLAGSNAVLSVTVATSATLPQVNSGTLRLWLKADAGVVTNAAGLVSTWQDQSGNANNATQVNTNLQPSVVVVPGLTGHPAVRFNGIQDNNVHGSYMHGTGSVGIPNAMTAFTVYNAFSATNNENVIWAIGTPGQYYVNRISMITAGLMHFSFWAVDYSAPFTVPTNTYRIRTDRLNTNLNTLEMFDATAATATNFSLSVSGAQTPGAGYYLGGLNSSQSGVGSSRNFRGDIAEMICYQGYLTDADRLAVAGYLAQKYYQGGSSNVSYQWQYFGQNIAGATNSTLTLTNLQLTNAGNYDVVISNAFTSITSSNATIVVDAAPVIIEQPESQFVTVPSGATLSVGVSGYPPPAFQWLFNGTNVSGATNGQYSIGKVAPGDGGNYSVLISNSIGSATSSNAVLSVNYLMATRQGQPQQLAATNLTVPSTVRPGTTFTVSSVATSSQEGGSAQLTNGIITYTPPAGFTGEDIFDYTLTPASGITTIETVTVLVDSSTAISASFSGGQATVQFAGLPGVTYSVQASTDLQHWIFIGSAVAGPDGRFSFLDFTAGFYDHRFYRTSLP
jgi:hypothetical protein